MSTMQTSHARAAAPGHSVIETTSAAPPRFSVVIPTYNRAHLLPRAVRSVLGQTLADFELIVVDDGSTDGTRELVAGMRDPRLRYGFQPNAGAASARNHGARLATGEFLTFLDSDDEALPHWLESLDRAAREHHAAIVCCGLTKEGSGPEVEKFGRLLLPEDMGAMLGHAVGRFTNGGVFAMRREVFAAVGGYVDGLRTAEHTDLGIRLVPLARQNRWRIHNVMEPLVRVHVHAGPRLRTDPGELYAGAVQGLRMHRELLRGDPRLHAKLHAIAGVNAVRIGRYPESRHHFLEAVRIDPRRLEHWARLALSVAPALAHLRWPRAFAPTPGRTEAATRDDGGHLEV
jgi:glycosyltransferase involved in cell wall biosynthesis